jgi:hypothetical protein
LQRKETAEPTEAAEESLLSTGWLSIASAASVLISAIVARPSSDWLRFLVSVAEVTASSKDWRPTWDNVIHSCSVFFWSMTFAIQIPSSNLSLLILPL